MAILKVHIRNEIIKIHQIPIYNYILFQIISLYIPIIKLGIVVSVIEVD
jgi:hypothetical protein